MTAKKLGGPPGAFAPGRFPSPRFAAGTFLNADLEDEVVENIVP